MSGGERGVAAEVDFAGGSKPPQVVAIFPWRDECRLGEVHFGGHRLHPLFIARHLEQAHGGGIAMERLVREGIDLEKGNRHGSSSTMASTSISTR